jgi:hypothetical protein
MKIIEVRNEEREEKEKRKEERMKEGKKEMGKVFAGYRRRQDLQGERRRLTKRQRSSTID